MVTPVVTAADVRSRLQQQRHILRRYGVAAVAVFGSVARGEASPDSDVDLLVDFADPIGAFAVIRLESELTEVLGRRVDLVTRAALRPRLHDRILAEAVNAA